MNKNIFNPRVQQFLTDNLKADLHRIALNKSPFENITSRELAEQLDSKKRAEKKIPLWYNTPGIIFPAKLSVEQSSSQLTAEYKNRLIKGDKIIDLTGGFGVDTFFFSKNAKEVVHCEKSTELSLLAEHNLSVLGANNVRFINADSIVYLKESSETFDTVYVDPSRRIESKKVFLLSETEPDVISNLSLFLSKATRVIIKTSPLFDIQSGLNELSQVSQVHVVSVKNDCKELLWVIDKDFTGEAEIISTAIGPVGQKSFQFKFSDEKNLKLESYTPALKYLYEPDVSLLKAGCFKSISEAFNVVKLHQHSHLYTSNTLVDDFPGKTFLVKNVIGYKQFIKENQLKKANVISRNFPHSPDELKKKHKISDGGTEYLIFTTTFPDKLLVIHAQSMQ
ncbi:hypothetical protein WG906_08445 [Pedobacter sp. P351]|uniref:class I SAM-dependent methyltransferase n=1 Tax=Pedobacter superstes TaxID=3133441 RepID=UPI0030A64D4E